WWGSGTYTVESTPDDGQTWTYEATLIGSTGYNQTWSVPAPIAASAYTRVRMTRSSPLSTSTTGFFTVLPGSPGPSFASTTVDATGDVGGWCSLALNSANVPGIAYRNADQSAARFGKSSGGPMVPEPIETGSGAYTKLRFFNDVPNTVYMA